VIALADMPADAALLDAPERARLARLRSPQQARRYAARRSALRIVLGAALEIPPQDVPLELGPQGKPRVAGERSLSFNLSHRGDTAVVALAHGSAVGVDVESARAHTSPQRLAERFFHADEAATIAALPAELATDAFLRCWTAKEAVLKALGSGLSGPLNEVMIAPDPREPLRLLRAPAPLAPEDWTLHELCLARGRLRLTLAVAAAGARIAGVRELRAARSTR
jgi:4'-phosphopantetheinyl transferase